MSFLGRSVAWGRLAGNRKTICCQKQNALYLPLPLHALLPLSLTHPSLHTNMALSKADKNALMNTLTTVDVGKADENATSPAYNRSTLEEMKIS